MKFHFEAFDGAGKLVVGEIDAASEAEARQLVCTRGVTPFAIRSGRPIDFLFREIKFDHANRLLSDSKFARLSRDLGILLQAGLPLDTALRILSTTVDDKWMSNLILRLLEGILHGATLADAMHGMAPVFRPEYIRIVQAGDAGADVAAALIDLADLLDRRVQAQSAVRAAMAYPALLVALAFVSLWIVLDLLVPAVTPIFLENGKTLPTILWVLNTIRTYSGPVSVAGLVVVASLGIAIFFARRRPATRVAIDRMILRTPVFGRISEARQASRFTRTLATLIKAGVAPLQALQTACPLVGNADTRGRLQVAIDDVRAGATIGDALNATRALPAVARQMIVVGEESGCLQGMLLRAALILERQEQVRTNYALAILTPTVTIFVSGLIAAIILSIMGAILSINDLALQ